MNKILTGVLAAATLAGALTATTALPAAAGERHGWRGERHEWRRDRDRDHDWRRDRGWGGGGAAAAAIIGLAAGAAIAGDGYGGGYAYPQTYYAPACHFEMRWNPYWRGYERVRVCY